MTDRLGLFGNGVDGLGSFGHFVNRLGCADSLDEDCAAGGQGASCLGWSGIGVDRLGLVGIVWAGARREERSIITAHNVFDREHSNKQ